MMMMKKKVEVRITDGTERKSKGGRGGAQRDIFIQKALPFFAFSPQPPPSLTVTVIFCLALSRHPAKMQ
jgi:hypothetical protein